MLGTVQTTPEEFENGFFTLKTHQMFSVTLKGRNPKTQQSPVMCLRKTRAGKSHDYRNVIVFEKLRFKMFPIHTENANPSYQIPPV